MGAALQKGKRADLVAEVLQYHQAPPKSQGHTGGRLESLDLARGVLILLVIFVHSFGHNFVYVAGPGTISNVWDVIVSATKPIRMPAFFLISGFLAKSLIRQSWPTLLRKRVLFLLYIYAIWLFISFVVFSYMDDLEGTAAFSVQEILTSFFSALIVPYSFLWFLWALALYNVIARATLSAPVWLVLGVAAAVSAFSEQLSDQPSFIIKCAVFFLLGARCPEVVATVSARASWKWAVILSGAYVACVGLIFVLGEKFPGAWLPAGLVGSAALIMLVTLVSGWPGLAAVRYCGRNTLQLYVLHPMVIGVLTFLEVREFTPVLSWLRSLPPMLAIHPIVFVAIVTILSLMVWKALSRVGLSVLFEAPWTQSTGTRANAMFVTEGSGAVAVEPGRERQA